MMRVVMFDISILASSDSSDGARFYFGNNSSQPPITSSVKVKRRSEPKLVDVPAIEHSLLTATGHWPDDIRVVVRWTPVFDEGGPWRSVGPLVPRLGKAERSSFLLEEACHVHRSLNGGPAIAWRNWCPLRWHRAAETGLRRLPGGQR